MTQAEASRSARLHYAPPAVRWGIPTALLVILGFVLLILVFNLVLPLFDLSAEIETLIVWVLGYGMVLLTLALVARFRGTGSWRRDFGLRFRWYDVFIGLGSGIAVTILAAGISAPIVLLLGGGVHSNDVAASQSGVFLALNGFLAVVVVAPFAEELLFRGLVLRSIRNAMLRPAGVAPSNGRRFAAGFVAVAVSALLFAALHLYEGIGSPATMVSLGVSTLVLGIVNGVYAVTLNRLGPGIATHMTFNLIGAIVATANAHS